MKKRGILFIVIIMVMLLACSLIACDEIAGVTERHPTYLSFESPYKTSSSISPVYVTGEDMEAQEGDFSFDNVLMYVEYSDGTKGEAIAVTESMLAPENTGNYQSETGWQTFTVQYTVDGTLIKGTFRVYTKVRTLADFATLTFVSNGGTPNVLTKQFTKGSEFTTYTGFTSSFSKVTKAGYTLLGWVILKQDFDYTTKTAEQINTEANALAAVNIYSPTTWPTDIQITRNMAFAAVWQENTTNVTFNYNFSKFNITSDLYASSGLPANPVSNLYAPNSTLSRPLISDQSIPGWKFVGWFTDENLTAVRSFNQQVGGADFTLYAKWEKVYYSVTFNIIGGLLNDDYYIIDENDLLYEKTSPTQTASSNLLKGEVLKRDSSNAISRISYTSLSYKTAFNSGSKYYYLAKSITDINTSRYLSKGYYENEVSATNGYYYNFLGWFEDPDYIQPYLFNSASTVPARDLNLYAKWDIDQNVATDYYENYLFKDKYIVKADGTLKINGVNDINVAKIALPNSIKGKFITEIGNDAFVGCNLLSYFSIKQTSQLTTIGERAFRFCSKLENFNVELSDNTSEDISETYAVININNVGKDAFRGTTWLSAHENDWITVGNVLVKYNGPEAIQKIVATASELTSEEQATMNCCFYGDKLENVDTICADAFKGLAKLTHITIPNSIVTIEDDAFIGCKTLSSITVQETVDESFNLQNIGGSSFSETAWFKYPSASDNNYAQYNALILGSIYYRYAGIRDASTTMATIPAGISIIASDAFQDFDNIRSIDFSDKTSITDIGKNAFNDTTWYYLQGQANDGFIIVNGIVLGYIGRGTTVVAADGITTLNSVYIPEKDADGVNVTKIATNAFYGYYVDSIDSISMPETITEIEPFAFIGTSNLSILSYLGSAKPHTYDGVDNVENSLPVIYSNSFDGTTSGVLVNSDLTIYLTTEINSSGSSLHSMAINNTASIYYKMYSANNSILESLINNGIRVKTGTLADRYVNYPGWSLNAEWEETAAFDLNNDDHAVLVIMRSDGLPYETPLLREYIDDLTVVSTLATSTPHELAISYNGFDYSFEYYVEPKISSITVDNGESENSLMSQAVYFTTSNRFVYSGGYINVNYMDASVESLRIPLSDNVGSGRLVQITNFTVSRAGTFDLKFTYSAGLQSVYCYYQYSVADPIDVGIEFYEPVVLEINSSVDLTSVILKIIRNDIKDGGQIFDIGGSGYDYYYVTMKNAKVRITTINGVEASDFDTSAEGDYEIKIKFGSETLGYTPEATLSYTVVLKTLDSWFTFEPLTTTTDVWNTVDGNTIYEGTAQITSINAGHLPTVVIPEYMIAKINDISYRFKIVELANNAFENDTDLIYVYVPSTVEKIGNSAFSGCVNLQTVNFMQDETSPSELQTIGSNAFKDCTSLLSIELPDSVSEVGNYAFAGSALISIDLSMTAITELPSFMFEYCLSLETIVLSTGLTVVGNNAFYGCTKLASIDLSENIEYIGTYAFSYCDLLSTITINATVPPIIGTSAFGVVRETLNIRVPSMYLSDYTATWSAYESMLTAF